MATIAVFDDDASSLARIRELVEQCAPEDDQRVILEASTVQELAEILSQGTHIDILISDIMMGDEQPSGIDVVQQLFPPSSGTQVIYASGYLTQATEVYRTNHVYFLLKPIDPEKLSDALRRAYAALPAAQPPMLRIKVGHKEHLIAVSSIRYIESNMHKVTVHCGTKSFVAYARLDDLEAQLPSWFTRCHRSFLVNLCYAKSLQKSELLLLDGTSLPVSRRREREVQRDLLAFLSSKGITSSAPKPSRKKEIP
ncbi:MAG: response regulator transcription factor [Atopobiaceae bacterium]|nr:response regulator transcription factor [Atopobiaceae bacterium]